MIAFIVCVIYAAAWPLAYRRQYVRNETQRLRELANNPRTTHELYCQARRYISGDCTCWTKAAPDQRICAAWYITPACWIGIALPAWEIAHHTSSGKTDGWGDAMIPIVIVLFLVGLVGMIVCDCEYVQAPAPVNRYNQVRPGFTATLWPLIHAIRIIVLPITLAGRLFIHARIPTLAGKFLHPEIKIPDPEKIVALEKGAT